MKYYLLVLVGIGGIMITGATADVLTQTFYYGDPESSTEDYGGTAIFNKYSGNGILTQVVIRATLQANYYSIELDNDSAANPLTGFVTLGATSTTTLSDNDPPSTTLASISLDAEETFSVSLEKDDGDGTAYQQSGPDWGSYSVLDRSTDETSTYTEELSRFSGSGHLTWTYDVKTYNEYSLTGTEPSHKD